MISLDSKTKTSSSPLGLAPQETPKSNGFSFSQLLHGVNLNREEKVVQNDVIVLALGKETQQASLRETVTLNVKNISEKTPKPETLLSLLQGSTSNVEKKTFKTDTKKAVFKFVELNPNISKNMKHSELKALIYDAKKYLKDKITQSLNFKQSEIKTLPKTLKGLAQVAKKLGMNVSTITLEYVHPKLKTEVATLSTKIKEEKPKVEVERVVSKVALKIENEVKKNTDVITEPKVALKPQTKKTVDTKVPITSKEIKQEIEQELKVTPKVALKPQTRETVDAKVPITSKEIKQEIEQELKVTPKVALKPQTRETVDAKVPITSKEIKQEIEQELKVTPKVKLKSQIRESVYTKAPITSKDTKQEVKTQLKVEPKVALKPQTKETVDAKASMPVLPKETPLFKIQTLNKEITTQQLMSTKTTTKALKPSKEQKEDETLKLLLQGKKSIHSKSSVTTDFSVALAGVVAPEVTTKSHATLESLLHNSTNENSTADKIDGFAIPKAESLELKMHEAKQMTKYISQDVKTAIEDYKSPFTRVKVELHPQRLGSVELTVVQRGKNLHIHLSSNNAAINALALNANDLKVQLSNNGINNASLNFNNNSQGADSGFSGQQQQQNFQHGRDAQREYSYFKKEENNEEVSNSLEIVVPNYA